MTTTSFGAHTFGFVATCDAETALERLADAGFTTVQLMGAPPHFDPWRASPGLIDRLARRIATRGLRLLALDLSSHDVNLASLAPAVVDFAVASYSQAAERARDLGAEGLCVASGRRHPLLPDDDPRPAEVYRAAFGALVEMTDRFGLKLLLENHPQGVAATATAIADLLAREGAPHVGVVWDVANAVAAGDAAEAGFTRLADRLQVVHLSDTPRGGWRHDPIGTGDVDFAAVAVASAAAGYSGATVLEILSADPLADLVDGRRRLTPPAETGPRGPRRTSEEATNKSPESPSL